jgi:hypothetical protein
MVNAGDQNQMSELGDQKSQGQILNEIALFMKRHPGPPESWFVGTAKDCRNQLFNVHGFKKGDVGLYRVAGTASNAAALATQLVDRGCQGDPGQKPEATSVYIFRMGRHTSPTRLSNGLASRSA